MRRPVIGLIVAAAAVWPALAGAEPNECTLPDDAVAQRDLAYVTRATGPVKLDLFTPPGDGPFPVVVWLHGGAWKLGDKAEWPHMHFLVRHGYAVADVEYRFSQVAPFPAQRDDVLAALDYLAGHAAGLRLDASRLAVAGESAGGHLAALAGLARPAAAPAGGPVPPTTGPATAGVRAVIDLFGPTDLTTLVHDGKLQGDLDQLLGGPMAQKAGLAADASPVTHVRAGAPAFLVLHGTKDPLVPIAQSETFVAKLKAAGGTVHYVPVDGAGHAGAMFWTADLREKMTAFLGEALAPRK